MFKSLAVIVSISILFQSFPLQLGDFYKLPDLVNHISQHIEKNDSLTDFIAMHYGCELKNHNNEHKEHQKLPFKHINFDSHIQLVIIPSFIENSDSQLENSFKKPSYHYSEPLAHLVSNYIFQPPRAT